uniref:HAT C-terminal dimerisation domain-containing protein n=1 Tax=Amphimedon queenslandica TaxID=400682 RepID=A0A1X7UUD3_AMPQE
MGHTLQLSVQKCFGVDRVARVLAKVCKLVEYINKSSKSTNEFRFKQALLDFPRHEFVQQVDTRWGSIYHMRERMVERHPALSDVLLGDECTLIAELLLVLKLYVQSPSFKSASSYPTIVMVYPLFTFAKKAELAIFEDLDGCYAQEDLVLLLKKCAVLDPPFKDLNPFVPILEYQDGIEAVKCDLIHLIEKQGEHEGEGSEANPLNPPKAKKSKVASLLFSDFSNCKDSPEDSSAINLVHSELRRYTKEDLLQYDDDLVDWWKAHKSHYPILAKLVRQF